MSIEKVDQSLVASQHSFDAALNDQRIDFGPDEERKLKRRVDWAIIPYCTLLYLLSFLDRVNIGQARTAGLEKDLKLKGNQYSIALTVFFVSYVAFEVPSNLLLRRFKPHRIITLSMISWALIMISMGMVKDFAGLATARFLLGVAEGGLFPGINLLITHWYTRDESNWAVSIFFAGATLAGAFGGILAFGIRHMAGRAGRDGWAWIFIIEGILTLLCALPGWWLVPDFPEDAKFLGEPERTKWLARLERSQGVTSIPVPFTWAQVRRAFCDWKTYVYSLMYIGIAQPFYSLALFTPTIIKALGFTNAAANLLSVSPYACGFVSTLLVALASDRLCMRGPFIIGGMTLVIIGYAVIISPVSVTVHYFAIHLTVIGVSPCIATCITWVGNNFGPTYTRAAVMGFFFAMGNSAGLVSSNVYPVSEGPRYIRGQTIAMAFSAISVLCAIVLMIYNQRENARRDAVYGPVSQSKGRAEQGETLDLYDRQRWRLGLLSEREIVELGDRHPAYRYIL